MEGEWSHSQIAAVAGADDEKGRHKPKQVELHFLSNIHLYTLKEIAID